MLLEASRIERMQLNASVATVSNQRTIDTIGSPTDLDFLCQINLEIRNMLPMRGAWKSSFWRLFFSMSRTLYRLSIAVSSSANENVSECHDHIEPCGTHCLGVQVVKCVTIDDSHRLVDFEEPLSGFAHQSCNLGRLHSHYLICAIWIKLSHRLQVSSNAYCCGHYTAVGNF